jgi:hypothetical protein
VYKELLLYGIFYWGREGGLEKLIFGGKMALALYVV